MDECKTLAVGRMQNRCLAGAFVRWEEFTEESLHMKVIRGSHSSTFQLNLSALYGLGGARRGCVARVKGVLGGA